MRCGIDLVHIPSFRKQLECPEFIARVFSGSELANRDIQTLSTFMAVKEAVMKIGPISCAPKFTSLHVDFVNGRYSVMDCNGALDCFIDVTCDGVYALATVVSSS